RPEDKAAAFARSSVALAASGTVALELARAEVAGVITYRLSSATFQAIQRQTTLDHFSLINILAQADVMPERLQHDARAELLAADVGRLLRDDTARWHQVEAQSLALATLALSSGQSTATLVADRLETLLGSAG
ncbi:MAG: lipid-A-disaccharide synthase, partial [Pseudomonadota bacterium]|nr:lipid-A-disaccharide synthase [Pseudomonadota bacterium]